MSQYTHIFARKWDTFIELACYSSGCYISDALNDYAPWEKIHLLTVQEFIAVIDNLKLSRDNYKDTIKRHEETIKEISQFNNSVDDKIVSIQEEQRYIEECQQELNEIEAALAAVYFIRDINADIYVGCECGSNVTVDSIEEGSRNEIPDRN